MLLKVVSKGPRSPHLRKNQQGADLFKTEHLATNDTEEWDTAKPLQIRREGGVATDKALLAR